MRRIDVGARRAASQPQRVGGVVFGGVSGLGASGMSVAKYAGYLGVSVPTLYQWRRRLGVDIGDPVSGSAKLVEVTLARPAAVAAGGLVVRLCAGRRSVAFFLGRGSAFAGWCGGRGLRWRSKDSAGVLPRAVPTGADPAPSGTTNRLSLGQHEDILIADCWRALRPPTRNTGRNFKPGLITPTVDVGRIESYNSLLQALTTEPASMLI